MPNWRTLVDEIDDAGSVYDQTRRKYLVELHQTTGRNVIVYYSSWLQKPELVRQGMLGFEVNDGDKNAFMATIHQLDRSKGLDLFLHTPGGDVAAAESLVDYLRSMFGTDIRTIVPQIALSAGTMIACACKQIVMGKHSSLGPIDPQFGGLPAHGIIEEFARARYEVTNNPATIPLWQVIISKYHPTLIRECEKAIKWAEQMVRDWLETGMVAGSSDSTQRADRVITELGSHTMTMSHARHISLSQAQTLGLEVLALEDDNALQDAVLSVHHACIVTMAATGTIKLVENQLGVTFVQGARIE